MEEKLFVQLSFFSELFLQSPQDKREGQTSQQTVK